MQDNLGLESECDWGVPLLNKPTTVSTDAKASHKTGSVEVAKPSCVRKSATPVKTHVISPLPHTYISPKDLPTSYDPRNIGGIDFTTVNRNQHIPHCRSNPDMSSLPQALSCV